MPQQSDFLANWWPSIEAMWEYRERLQGERKPLPKHPETVSVSRIGSVFIASVGRVRAVNGCPLVALAEACEWSRVLAFG